MNFEDSLMPVLSSRRRLARQMLYKFTPFKWKEEVPRNVQSSVKGESSIPKERSGHRIIFHEGSIYAFGGYNPSLDDVHASTMADPEWISSKPLFRELWRFNTHSQKWSKIKMLGEVPKQLASHTATLVDIRGQRPKLMVYGGTGMPYGVITSHEIFMFDLKTHRWEVLQVGGAQNASNGLPPNLQYPEPLYGQAVVLDKSSDDFYTVGGTSGYNYFIDIHKINMREKLWEEIFKVNRDVVESPTVPSARYRHELAFYKGRIFVLGGGTSMDAEGFCHVNIFDVQTRAWLKLRTKPDPTIPINEGIEEQYPAARRCHGVVQHDKYVFVFGGYDGSRIADGTWRLDLETLEWRRLPHDLPQPVYFNAAAISPSGKMFSFGGVTSIEQNSRSNAVFSCWPIIPRLRDICWEALNHYNPHLDRKPVELLVREGIPQDLVDMLHGTADSVG